MRDREPAATVTIVVPDALQPLMFRSRRASRVTVPDDGTSTLWHLVGAIGIPPTEVGGMDVGGRSVDPAQPPPSGAVIELQPRERPQPVAAAPARFLLDVHLGTLARKLRVLGVDAAWTNDASDAELVARALAERRVLLTRDRGLLMRRALVDGAYVFGDDPDDQLDDVLDRFAPPLAPWTRCPACNGELAVVPKSAIEHELQPGTRRSYARFSRCRECRRIYWAGAHHQRLSRMVARYVPAARDDSRRSAG